MARRQHWMKDIADSLKQRIELAVPSVSAGIKGDVPLGYESPKPDDEVRNFLNSSPQQRQQMFMEMGPDGYRKWSSGMMDKLNTRFGAAASVLYPMLEAAPMEVLAQGQSLDDSSMGVASAQAELTDLLGFNPFE